jgi:hypothetical protein
MEEFNGRVISHDMLGQRSTRVLAPRAGVFRWWQGVSDELDHQADQGETVGNRFRGDPLERQLLMWASVHTYHRRSAYCSTFIGALRGATKFLAHPT